MCGLAGIFAYHADAPPVDAAELARINDAQAHRGPDGAGTWIAGNHRLGLAHRRLAIIDLDPRAAQPMTASVPGHSCRIVFNGEIYNFHALRRDLETQGHRFATASDTEVLLHLYLRHGPAMVRRLRGMFAFALWDETRRGLLLARDPFGIKPLYWADDGRTVRVASQVKALRAGGRAGTGVDPAGHVGFFVLGSVPDPHTLYADIRSVPAGTTLWVDGDGPRAPEPFFDPAERGPAADLGGALRDSAAHHLVADVPVGLFLSAGLDSASLAGLCAERHGGGLETVTLAFDEYRGTADDEAPLAERVAATYATRHLTRRVRGADFRAHVDAIVTAMDQPSIDGVNTWFVARAAAEAGLKVAVSGLGGDEVFGGYDTFRTVPRLAAVLGRVPGGRRLGRLVRAATAPLAARLGRPKAAGLVEYGTGIADAWLLRRALFMPWELPSVLDPDLARAGWAALRLRERLAATAAAADTPARAVQFLEAGWYMRHQLLRDADWAGMAHALEIRVPLVDPVLWRAVALRHTKADMAATVVPPLPDAVRNRPKTGFQVPVTDWLGDDGRGLRGWARRVYAAFAGR